MNPERSLRQGLIPVFFLIFAALSILSLSLPLAGAARSSGVPLDRGEAALILAGESGGPPQVSPPPLEFLRGAPQTAVINITYQGGWPGPGQTAFRYAADIWETQISSSVPIEIIAVWDNSLPQNALGSAGPTQFYRDFSGAPFSSTWYPVSLANKLAGVDLFAGDDISASFNSNLPNWYFGTDGNPPGSQFDFVSVALHEIGHGLGFLGSMQYGQSSCGGSNWGCWGWGTAYPAVYDRFTESQGGNALLGYPNPSSSLGTVLTTSVLFDGPYANAGNGGSRVPLYAPSTWNPGSSYAHLAQSFDNTPNALMTYSISQGEAQHNPGPVTLGMFTDMGWEAGGATPTATRTPTRTPTKTRTPTPTIPPNTLGPGTGTPNYLALVRRDHTPTPTRTPTASPTPSASPTAAQVTITEMDFEGIFPGAWTLPDTTGGQFDWGKRACRSQSGLWSGWATGGGLTGTGQACGTNYPTSADTWMVYGPFSLADAGSAGMTLSAWINTEQGADILQWLASNNGTNFFGWQTSGNSSGWADLSLDLGNVPGIGSLLGESQVWVALRFSSGPAGTLPEGVYVDDIRVEKCTASCNMAAAAAGGLGFEPVETRLPP